MGFFDKLTGKDPQKEIYSIDRPVVIDGVELLAKLDERLGQIKENICQVKTLLETEYASCIEGSAKANKKRECQKVLHDYTLKELWFARLKKVIREDKAYALSLVEAINLGIVEDVIVE